MTETAETVIKDALQMINTLADEEPLEASIAQTTIRALNRMMDKWSAQGINLGYSQISQLSDLITVPATTVAGIVANLAVEVAPTFSREGLSPALLYVASDGMNAVKHVAITMGDTEYPDTLPIGSGNEVLGHNYDHFYPDQQGEILTENPGSIGLETGTSEDS